MSVCGEEGNGKGGKSNGNSNKEGGQVSNGGNNDDGDGDGTKDMAAHTATGEGGKGDDGGNLPWFVCEFLCVWRGHE